MTEENVDTTEAPAESVEPTEPTEIEETPEEAAPGYVTVEDMQAALEKQDASFRSWLGRRDKETLNHIGQVINERLSQAQNQPTPEEMSTRLLDDPRAIIRSEMEAYENERTTKQITHLNTAMETVGNLMESDPLYTDKELGNEVVAEIKSLVQANKVDHKVAPAKAGKLVLADALSNVLRKRQGLKTNPLGANTPKGAGSNLKPPSTPSRAKPKMPKLDDITQSMAQKWGYSEEDLAALYGE